MTVNERVSCALIGQKATQRDLAAAIGVSTSTLNNWLKLGRDIPAQYIVPICEFFDVSLSFLLTGSETEKAPVPGISENGREMLALYEKLPEREQVSPGDDRAPAWRDQKERPGRGRVIRREGRVIYVDFT